MTVEFDISPYKRVSLWFSKVKEICPGYEDILVKNLSTFKALIDKNKGASS